MTDDYTTVGAELHRDLRRLTWATVILYAILALVVVGAGVWIVHEQNNLKSERAARGKAVSLTLLADCQRANDSDAILAGLVLASLPHTNTALSRGLHFDYTKTTDPVLKDVIGKLIAAISGAQTTHTTRVFHTALGKLGGRDCTKQVAAKALAPKKKGAA